MDRDRNRDISIGIDYFLKALQVTGVKDCEGFGILLYLQANMLTCHNFIDGGMRHEKT